VIDQFYENGHDDPQHFEMAAFSAAVQKYKDTIDATASARKLSDPKVKTQYDITKHALPALNAAADVSRQ
jgi:hypothetical protein